MDVGEWKILMNKDYFRKKYWQKRKEKEEERMTAWVDCGARELGGTQSHPGWAKKNWIYSPLSYTNWVGHPKNAYLENCKLLYCT